MNEYSDEFLAQVDLEKLGRAEAALWGAFIWGGSPQGHEAWHKITITLGDIYRAAEAWQVRRRRQEVK